MVRSSVLKADTKSLAIRMCAVEEMGGCEVRRECVGRSEDWNSNWQWRQFFSIEGVLVDCI